MTKSEAFRAINENLYVLFREIIREVVQEELKKKEYNGIEHLRKVILAESGGMKNA